MPVNHSIALATWRCPRLIHNTAQPPSLPVAVYAMGPAMENVRSNKRIGTFLFTPEASLGDIYVISSASRSSPPAFDGEISVRKCSRALVAKPSSITMRSGHVSATFARHKLNLLQHLPPGLDAVVLVDFDAYCVGACVWPIAAHLAQTSASQFVVASQSGNRVWEQRCRKPTEAPASCAFSVYGYGIVPADETINSGLLALNLTRFRWFERDFGRESTACAGDGELSWWRCVMRHFPPERSWATADQSVWHALLSLRPEIVRWLPCGTHVETEGLKGVAVRLGFQTSHTKSDESPFAPLCNAAVMYGGPAKGRHWFTADDCRLLSEDDAIRPWSGAAAAAARLRITTRLREHVLVTHGAANMRPLAWLVARALTSPLPHPGSGQLVGIPWRPCACFDSSRNTWRKRAEKARACVLNLSSAAAPEAAWATAIPNEPTPVPVQPAGVMSSFATLRAGNTPVHHHTHLRKPTAEAEYVTPRQAACSLSPPGSHSLSTQAFWWCIAIVTSAVHGWSPG